MLFKKQNQKIDSKVELNSVCQALEEISVCQALEEITNYIILLKQIQTTTTYDLSSAISDAVFAQDLLRHFYFKKYKGWEWHNASL